MERSVWRHRGIRLGIASMLLIASCGRAGTEGSARERPSAQALEASIAKAETFIFAQQNAKGTWENTDDPAPATNIESRARVDGGQWGGLTALSTYALITAGVSPTDPRLTKAIAFLKSANLIGTYALAMRCQVWSVLPTDNTVRMKARADAATLVASMIDQGRGQGFYNYIVRGGNYAVPNWWWDLSNSQMAILGAWACDHACGPGGAQIPLQYWQTADAAWRAAQYPSGAWPYSTEDPGEYSAKPRLSITAAGVATLLITDEYLHRGQGLLCKGYSPDTTVEQGMAYIADHFSQMLDAPAPNCYGLYAMERIGVASGRRFFTGQSAPPSTNPSTQPAKIDWFAEGADDLLARQNKDGSWGKDDAQEKLSFNPQRLPDTCFAAIFLSRGRLPLAITKLQYQQRSAMGELMETGGWNQRPRDAANLTRWIGNRVERGLNWQVASLDDPMDQLRDAPILYIAGSGQIDLTPAQQNALREYVDDGGLVIGNADCGNNAFSASFEKLGQALFPDDAFIDVPKNDPIYAANPRSRLGSLPVPLRLISNGVRPLMILIPTADPARNWQRQASADRPDHFELIENIFLRTTDQLRELKSKGQDQFPTTNPAIPTVASVKVARLKYEGNWDPEPAGWRRLAAILQADKSIDLQTTAVDPAALDATYSMASLTGTGQWTWSEEQRQSLRAFIERGGLLVVDAAGGDRSFADCAEKELAQLLPESTMHVVEADDPAINDEGVPIPVAYQDAARAVVGKSNVAALRVIAIGGRPAVYFSREDLSAGLLGKNLAGVVGYTANTATALMEHLVMLSARAATAAPIEAAPASRPDGS